MTWCKSVTCILSCMIPSHIQYLSFRKSSFLFYSLSSVFYSSRLLSIFFFFYAYFYLFLLFFRFNIPPTEEKKKDSRAERLVVVCLMCVFVCVCVCVRVLVWVSVYVCVYVYVVCLFEWVRMCVCLQVCGNILEFIREPLFTRTILRHEIV